MKKRLEPKYECVWKICPYFSFNFSAAVKALLCQHAEKHSLYKAGLGAGTLYVDFNSRNSLANPENSELSLFAKYHLDLKTAKWITHLTLISKEEKI